LPVALRFKPALLVSICASLVALAPATAPAHGSTVFVHSAASGELSGGRLILREVGRHVTWTHAAGRSGVLRIARLHDRLFAGRTPRASGTLHIAGHRGGDEQALRLSRPRFNASRGTVSYRVRRISKRRPEPGARASQSREPGEFGASSLSIVPAPQVASGDNGGNDCGIGLVNETGFGVQPTGSSKWDTDTWATGVPTNVVPSHAKDPTGADIRAYWESDGGLLRGCSNSSTWQLVVDPNDPGQAPPPAGVTYTLSMSWPWGSSGSPSCTSTNAQFYCLRSGSYYILRGPVPCCMPPSAVAAARR
jgi:hypothetical protein